MKRATLLLLSLAACAAPSADPDPSAVARAPIIEGTVDTTDTNVGMFLALSADGSGYICSGEIIGPHTFLTAGHCARDFMLGQAGQITTATDGLNVQPTDPHYLIDDAEAHPHFTEAGGAVDWNDIGILHIAAATPMPPPYLALNRYPLDRLGIVAKPVTQIGYGIAYADGGGAGTRRTDTKGDFTIKSGAEIQSGANHGLTCNGDSGGPAVMTTPDGVRSVIAVTSRGDEACAQLGIDTRVDAYLGFIKQYMSDHGDLPSCGADGRCGFDCTAPDPDCPCAPDGMCTSACADPSQDPDCPQSCLYDGGSCVHVPDAGSGSGSGGDSGGGCGTTGGDVSLGILAALLGLRLRRSRPR